MWTSNKLLLTCLSAITCSVVFAMDATSPANGRQALFERKVAALRSAGVDINSDVAIVAALRDERNGVQLGAIELVSERRINDAVPELERIAAGALMPAIIRFEACKALSVLSPPNASKWVLSCEKLLDERNDIGVRVGVAGILAARGDSRGWGIVANALGQKPALPEAAVVAPLFAGLDAETKGSRAIIDVFGISVDLFKIADEESQATLMRVIEKVAKPKNIEAIVNLKSSARSKYITHSIDILTNSILTKNSG